MYNEYLKTQQMADEFVKKYDDNLYSLYMEALGMLSTNNYNEILQRIKNKHGLFDKKINDFNELENYLYWPYIVRCVLFYFDTKELKELEKLMEGKNDD